MKLAKIVADLYLKTSNLAPKGKGRYCCATTSHGHNSEKKKKKQIYPMNLKKRGSFSSYQLSHTGSNFDVIINIDSVPRSDTVDHQIDRFPRFPLRNHPEGEQRFLSDAESEFVKKFHLYEDEINTLEGDTKEQANSRLLVSERK